MAVKIAQGNFGKVATSSTVKTGDNNQVLTETDLAVGKLLVSRVAQKYPLHNIIDEEAGVVDKGSEFTWVIDPIDGTSNFAVGSPHYGIMIGLLEGSTPIAGGIALPFFNKIYYAEKNKGAYCGSIKLSVSQETKLANALVAYGIDGHQEAPELTRAESKTFAEIVLAVRNIRNSGSCFDTIMVAEGKYGGYLYQSSKIWDNVAPQILLEESGCLVTDFFGNSIDYSHPTQKVKNNFTACAAPSTLHRALQQIIHNI